MGNGSGPEFQFVATEVVTDLQRCVFCQNAPWSYMTFVINAKEEEEIKSLFPRPDRVILYDPEKFDENTRQFRINGCRHHARTLLGLLELTQNNGGKISGDVIRRALKRIE